MGEVDELNFGFGVLFCEELLDVICVVLFDIQNDFFDFGGEFCLFGMEVIKEVQVG